MKILAVESSCDDTAAAVVDSNFTVHSNIVFKQDHVHKQFGGIVPELASREHIVRIIPAINEALKQADSTLADLDGLAVTYGPGLLGSLLVGVQTIKGIALSTKLPWIGIHHLEGHLSASLLSKQQPSYPHLALIVSGGHTLLLRVEKFGTYYFLGGTRDDAAGEAYDKVAKLLNIGFPGGVVMEAAAKGGDPNAIKFPRPLLNKANPFDFSFSGLKTAALNQYKKSPPHNKQDLADFCASFIEAVTDTLVEKSLRALKRERLPGIVLGGGVTANARLREKLALRCQQERNRPWFYLPEKKLCTDNAAMIGAAGIMRLQNGEHSDFNLTANANVPLAPPAKNTAHTAPKIRRRGLQN